MTNVYPDGKFDAHSLDGTLGISGASSDCAKLEDENGNPINPALSKTPEEELREENKVLHARVDELTGFLAVTNMNMEGLMNYIFTIIPEE